MPSVTRKLGARVEIDGEKEYKDAIKSLNAANQVLSTEMQKLQAEYKGNTESTEYLTKAGELLERELLAQQEKVETIRQKLAEAAKKDGEAATSTMQLQAALNRAETAEINLQHAIDENNAALQNQDETLTGLADELDQQTTVSATLRTEMQKLQAEYNGNTDSTEYLTKASDLLERELLQQKNTVDILREAVQRSAEKYGESNARTQEYIQQLNKAEAEQFNLQHALDDTNAALQNQGETMTGLGDTVDQLGEKFGIRLPDQLKTALNGVEGFSAGTVAAMAAAAAGVAALVAVFKELNDITLQVAADADEYLTQSAITSVPTELLQAWDYAAQFVDVSADTITGSMTKITKAMGDAQDGSGESAEAFAALGVSITDADGQLRSAQDVFYDVIDALGEVENQTERNILGMALMGKSEQELNPLINAGSEALNQYAKEAEELGYVLDKDQIEKLAEVDDAYQKTQLAVEALKKQIAVDFAPASKEAMELFSSVVQKAGEFLKRSGLIENLGSMFASLIDILETLGEFVSALPGVGQGLDGMNTALKEVAFTFALIADTIKAIVGLMPTMWGSGMLKQALGFDAKNGNYSNLQRINGTAATMEAQRNGYRGNGGEDMSGYGYDPSSGMYYDLTTGNYIFGHNATGNDNWRGGLTWVGEAGPELVSLPAGSSIRNAQDSRMGGDTFYITIDAASVKEFNDIVEMAQSARVRQRMR